MKETTKEEFMKYLMYSTIAGIPAGVIFFMSGVAIGSGAGTPTTYAYIILFLTGLITINGIGSMSVLGKREVAK